MKWEYAMVDVNVADEKFVDVVTDVMQQLDELGAKGWDLISVDRGVAYLKRPIAEAPVAAVVDTQPESLPPSLPSTGVPSIDAVVALIDDALAGAGYDSTVELRHVGYLRNGIEITAKRVNNEEVNILVGRYMF